MGAGRFLAVLARAEPKRDDAAAYAEATLAALAAAAEDDDARSRCAVVVAEEGNGSGCAPEDDARPDREPPRIDSIPRSRAKS